VSDMTEPPGGPDEQTRVDLAKHTSRARRASRSARTAAQVIEDVQHIATIAGEQAGKRQGRIFGVVGLLVAIVVSFLAGGLAVDNAAQLAAFRTQQDQRQTQIDDTLAKLADQNELLASRGQEPVAVPPPSADPTEAIAALVLSRVIAQLPAPPAVPTADEVAAAITPAVTANVLGPSQQQLTRMAADYYRSGGPAEAAIEAAVRRVIAENPPRDGRDGESPQCLSEPAQCRGKDGENGQDSTVRGPEGPVGPPGPTCEPGTHIEEVTLTLEMKTARICVVDDPPDEGP
jgi:hypothetical protein